MILRRSLWLWIASLLLTGSLRAQSSDEAYIPPFQAGARAGYLLNFHHTNANIFCCTECGTFSDGKGGGYALEFFGEFPVKFYRRLSLTFGLGFEERGGDFGETVTGGLPILDPTSNQYVTLTRQHSYDASLKYLSLSGGLRVQPLEEWPVYGAVSLEGELPVGRTTSYTQTESILQPQGVLYPENNSSTKVVGSGEIQDLKTQFVGVGTLGYEVPLSYTLMAAPELSYYLPLNTVESQFTWSVSSLRIGVAVRWRVMPELEEVRLADIQANRGNLQRKAERPPVPSLSVTSLSGEPLRILETTVTETFPILPYVFFDSASPRLPERFAQLSHDSVLAFNEANLPHHSLESYYNLLNVIAKRLQRDPRTHITLNGTTDGRELADREASRNLALARAARVKEYLTDVWAIDPNRIVITSSDAPTNPSSTEYQEGYEENRRVEIFADDDQILKPIVHERFREERSTPRTLPFQISSGGTFPLREWKITVRGKNGILHEESGQGNIPRSLSWTPSEHELVTAAHDLSEHDSLVYEVTGVGLNGVAATARTQVPANKITNPFELSRLSLIVFDFDQSNINSQNTRMITSFVSKSLYPSSTASIVGSTDNLGELKHNQSLSEARAMNVRDLILKEKPEAQITSTKGIGPTNLLYDNSLPEGRYYCRTVKVEVETPIESIMPTQ